MESILLSYKNENRISYQVYAEFLRLMGVYVCEDMIYIQEDKPNFDKMEDIFSVRYKIDDSIDSMDVNNKLYYLKQQLNCHFRVDGSDLWYDQLADIFMRNKLLQAGVTLQYFRARSKQVSDAGDCFEHAADDLVALVKVNPNYVNNRHIRYAKLFCKQKANEAKFFCKEPVVYYVDDLAVEGLSLLKVFPDFSNAWVLLGLIYRVSEDFRRDALDAFQRAISMVGDQPCMSSVYYYLGRQCEGYETLKALEYQAYRKAYRLMPKYRNMYKIAIGYMVDEQWEDALQYFKKCLQRLEKKNDFLDPLEQEYYFKINMHMCFIYAKRKEYCNVITCANSAVVLCENIWDGRKKSNQYTKFYFEMYKKDARNIIKLSVRNMPTRQAYKYLAVAYQELGMSEDAEYYWTIVKK